MTPEKLAQLFHEAYERLAPDFGYKTREASAVPWEDVPDGNKRLMVATSTEVLRQLGDPSGQDNHREQAALTLLTDLDRCRHGRHEGDACSDCPGGISAGNPFLLAGGQVGYDISSRRIVVPPRNRKHDPKAWISP